MLFSVVVPIYNIEKYLTICLDSLLNQTYKDIEIILVDDGSPDNCPDICDVYADKDKRIKVIHKENGGVVRARQAGFEIATGEYIACIDGDDWVVSTYFETFAEAVEKYNPDIICCGHYVSSETESKSCLMPNRKGLYLKKDLIKEIYPSLIQSLEGAYFSPALWGKVIKKEILLKQQLTDYNVTVGEDGACIIPCVFHSESMVLIDKCLYHYRVNQASATKSRKAFKWDWPYLVAEHIKSKIDINQYDFQEQLYRKTTHDLFSVVISQFFKKDKYRSTVRNIKEQLQKAEYAEAIRNARFKGLKANLMLFVLKHNLFFPIWAFSKIKRF